MTRRADEPTAAPGAPADDLLARRILYGSLLICIALSFPLAVRDAGIYVPLCVGLLAFAAACRVFLAVLPPSARRSGWILAVAVVNLFTLFPELLLRTAGFRYQFGIEFGYPDPLEFQRFEPDEDLFWKLPPASAGVNSLGFPEKEVETPKPPGLYRILFLGDSCTQQGFPRMVELFLNSERPDPLTRFESVTLALRGYSSHQGRVLARLHGARLEPDLVFVYYGWNDHWLAYGAADSEKIIHVPRGAGERAAKQIYDGSRVLQGTRWLLDSILGRRGREPLDVPRVPPPEYRSNLLEIRSVFDAAGARTVFVTAPTSHDRLGVPSYLVEHRFAPDRESVLRLHGEYNDIVREVARSSRSHLLDLQAELGSSDQIEEIFTLDGIHFTQAGLALVARRIAGFIRSELEEAAPGAARAGAGGP